MTIITPHRKIGINIEGIEQDVLGMNHLLLEQLLLKAGVWRQSAKDESYVNKMRALHVDPYRRVTMIRRAIEVVFTRVMRLSSWQTSIGQQSSREEVLNQDSPRQLKPDGEQRRVWFCAGWRLDRGGKF